MGGLPVFCAWLLYLLSLLSGESQVAPGGGILASIFNCAQNEINFLSDNLTALLLLMSE
jgi:hypothetical protein